MPEDDPPSEHAADHHRPFGRSKWKGNPFARKAKVVQEDDLSDFLHGPDGNTRPASRLDTDSVAPLPSSKNASQSTGSETSFAKQHASQPYVPSLNFLRKKKKGFTVRFTDAAPEIIGEGGDEAELPSMAVSRAHAYSSNTAEPRKHGSAPMGTYQTEKSEPPYSLPGGPVTKTDSGFMRMSLQRRPTGFDDVQYTEKGGAYTLGVDDNRREETTQGPGKLKLEDQQPFWTAPVPDIRLGEEKESKGDGALKTYAPIPVRPVPFLENRRERDSSPASSLLQAPTSAFGNGEPYPHNSSPWAEPFGATPLGHLPSSLLPGASTASLDDSSYRFAEEVAERDIDALLQSEEVEDYAESAVVPSGDEALHEFHTRTQHLDNAFRLAAAKGRSLMDISLSAWVRASTWFFLKGVSELESSTRKRPRSSGGPQDDGADNISPATMQAYVDLAKAWWIVKEVIPTHPQSDIFKNPVAKPPYSNPGDLRPAQLMQAHRLVAANMRALTISMKKSDLLPPGAIFIQGLDANIWVEYPTFPSDIVGILSGRSPRSLNLGNHIKIEPFFETPLSDTNRHFSYGRMFVEVSIVSDIKDIATRLPCLLSILRERTDSGVEATIVSQNGLVNIHLQGDERKSLTWDDVHWINKARIMRVNLGRLEIDVQLSEADYKTLWGIYNYTHKIAKNWYPRNNEEIVFDDVVKIFHYIDRPKPFSGFPRDQIRNCKIRVLEKKVLLSEGTGLRKIHDGHRLMVVTPPEMKALSSINQEFGKNSAITFSYLRGEDSAPALLLGTLDNGIKISMVITFNEAVRRAQLHSLLSGISVNRGESVLGEMPLEELQISTRTGDEAKLSFLPGVQWQQIRVINQSSDEYSYENPPTILSEHLRMIVNNNFGTIADRINIGPGEMHLKLDATEANTINLLRHPQGDLTLSYAENLLAKGDRDALAKTLSTIAGSPTVRKFKFRSLEDLHKFQDLVIGFSVQYDGIATSYAISRRMMVVPIYKRLESKLTRLQIVKQDKICQLVAFFDGFSLGHCMNFNLKSTDVFESSHKSGKYFLRLVDAKFALPKTEEIADNDFLCLDLPEYAGEHDDIMIGFDSEAERNRFTAALPAPVISKVSRMASFRRKDNE